MDTVFFALGDYLRHRDYPWQSLAIVPGNRYNIE